MTNIPPQHEQNQNYQAIDSAALAGAATAAALAVLLVPGPFVPLNGVVGLTLLIILLTYEMKRYRSYWQNLAFGVVCALCALLLVGFIIEFIRGGLSWNYLADLEGEIPKSRLTQWFLLCVWLILTTLFTGLGFRYALSTGQSTLAMSDSPEASSEERLQMSNKTKLIIILVVSGTVCILVALGTSIYRDKSTAMTWVTSVYGFLVTGCGIYVAIKDSGKST